MDNTQRAEHLKELHDAMLHAASYLAYDLTFRAENPTGRDGEHSPASPDLTATLKRGFVKAHNAYYEYEKNSRATA